jgi:hypothetical protein
MIERFISYTEEDGVYGLSYTEDFSADDLADVILNIFDGHPEFRAGIIKAATEILKPQYPANRPHDVKRPDKV